MGNSVLPRSKHLASVLGAASVLRHLLIPVLSSSLSKRSHVSLEARKDSSCVLKRVHLS